MKRQDVIYPIIILVLCALITFVVLYTTLVESPQSYTNISTSFSFIKDCC